MATHYRKTIEQDDLTKRFRAIYHELVTLGAIYKKSEYYTCLDISASLWAFIEDRERNFPKAEAKRSAATLNLVKQYHVNLDYLLGRSQKMFTQQPSVVNQPIEKDKRQFKMEIKQERDTLKKLYDKALEEIAMLKEQLSKYEPDKKTDKKH